MGCDIIANETGSAVGFSMVLNQCLILCTPGVPSELTHMLKDEIIPTLKTLFPDSTTFNMSRMQTFGLGESTLQALINDKMPNWPKEIAIGFRAAMPLLEVKLSVQGTQEQTILAEWQSKLSLLMGDHVLGLGKNNNTTIAEYVVPLLAQTKQKITVAESCTGGLIASQITAIPGSSAVFEAGFITYSNSMKTKLLNVPNQTLVNYGAVSKQTVLAMAEGALEQSSADFVIAVSGIAGPDGGTAEKPVGSVWIAWGGKHTLQAKYYCIPVARKYFQQLVAARSLDLIRRLLINSEESPNYNRVN